MEERTFAFDVDRAVERLDRILQMELAGVIYCTHYSFMIYGHARIPITSWLRDNALESLAHAQEAGQMISATSASVTASLPATAPYVLSESQQAKPRSSVVRRRLAG